MSSNTSSFYIVLFALLLAFDPALPPFEPMRSQEIELRQLAHNVNEDIACAQCTRMLTSFFRMS